MDMLERTESQKIILRKFSITIMVSVVLLGLLLIWQATKYSSVTDEVNVILGVGPIKLFGLHKIPIKGGYSASISFLPGLVIYFLVWLTVAVIWVIPRKRS